MFCRHPRAEVASGLGVEDVGSCPTAAGMDLVLEGHY